MADSIVEVIKNATESIESGDVGDLVNGLREITKFTKEELRSNETLLAYPIEQLLDAVERNIRVNSSEISPNLGIRSLIKDFSDILPKTTKRDLNAIINTIEKETKNIVIENAAQKVVDETVGEIEKQIIQEAVEETDVNNLIATNTLNLSPVEVRNSITLTPIERSVEMFKPILKDIKIPSMTRPEEIPSTMKLLTRYAEIKGTTGVGSITNGRGFSYVGVQEIKKPNGSIVKIPFPENKIVKTDIPDIPMQLQYHANRTINSWNNYVGSEAKFLNFISKVNTVDNRLSYVEKQFRTMNIQTYSAQMVATVGYYYIFLPIERMVTRMNAGLNVEPTFNGFIENYIPSGSPTDNPLLLSSTAGKELAKMLFERSLEKGDQNKSPREFCVHITDFLKKYTNELNVEAVDKLLEYPERKQLEARGFMEQSGLESNLIDSVLGSNDWSSVKHKKFILFKSFSNPQITQMAQKIVEDNVNSTQNKVKPISYIWGASEILAHDYIFHWGKG